MGMSLVDIYDYLGDEIELHRLYYKINPWGPERGDINAWQISSAATRPGCEPIPFRAFDVTRPAKEPIQTSADISAQLKKTAASWPGAVYRKGA